MAGASHSQWYYSRDGQRIGPLSGSELKRAADSGALTREDWVWKEGLADWVPASRVRGLFPDAPSVGEFIPPTLTGDPQLTSWISGIPQPSAASAQESKPCPYCGETILAVARKCKHCGEFLDGSNAQKGKAIFKASGDFIGVLCSYHIMDSRKRVLAKLKPRQSFEVAVPSNTAMYVWYSCGFGGAVQVQCRANEVNRFSVSLSQLGVGCVVSRVDVIDSD